MTECVILIRMDNGNISALADENEASNLHRFANHDEAISVASRHPLCAAMPYQIVELDEL